MQRGPDAEQILVVGEWNRLGRETSAGIGLQWFVDLALPGNESGSLGTLVSRLCRAPWAGEFDVVGRDYQLGTRIVSVTTTVDEILRAGESTFTFAKGGAEAAVNVADAAIACAISIHTWSVQVRLWCGEDVTRKYGAILLDYMIETVAMWRSSAQGSLVTRATAFPQPSDGFKYPHVRPRREMSRDADAIVEILDLDHVDRRGGLAEDVRKMLATPVSDFVVRRELGQLIVLRWVEDPGSPSLSRACSDHERWLVAALDPPLRLGWNDAGDLMLPLTGSSGVAPYDVYNKREGFGIVNVEDDSDATFERLRVASGKGPKGVRLRLAVFPARAPAVGALARLQTINFHPAYRDASGRMWDPFPPGLWIDR